MLDDRSPIYLQIADQIRDAVVTGTLGPDSPVMSTNQYAAAYRINPATAAKAFATLVDEGVIYKRRGIGMFVSPDAAGRLRRERQDRFFAERVEPMIAEAQAIGVPLLEILAVVEKHAGAAES